MSVFQLQEFWAVRFIAIFVYFMNFINNSNLKTKVKAGDSEEFDHGAMIVGNIDNSSPPATKICIGYCLLRV